MGKSNLKNLLKKSIDSQMSPIFIQNEKKVLFLHKFKKKNIFSPKYLSLAVLASLIIVIQISTKNFNNHSIKNIPYSSNHEMSVLIQNELDDSIHDDISDSFESSELDELVI